MNETHAVRGSTVESNDSDTIDHGSTDSDTAGASAGSVAATEVSA